MADEEIQLKKITELSESANATDGNLFAIGDETSGNLKKITTLNLGISLLGDADISEIGDGTVKGAINTIRRGEVDTADSIATFESGDDESPEAWTDVALIESGETHSSLFHKLSTMVKNIRWIMSRLGNTDISSIGDGTVTGSINTVQTDLNSKYNTLNSALAAKQNTISSYTWDMVDNLTVAANSTSNVNYGFPDSTYTYLGVIGYRVASASDNGQGHSMINVYSVRRLSTGIEFAVRNTSSSNDAKILIQVYLLRTT